MAEQGRAAGRGGRGIQLLGITAAVGALQCQLAAGWAAPRLPPAAAPGAVAASGTGRTKGSTSLSSSRPVPKQTWWTDPTRRVSAPEACPASKAPHTPTAWTGVQRALLTLGLPLIGGMLPLAQPPEPAMAADTVKVAGCLLKNCQLELAKCILDPKCLANIICINTCNGRADETECQIGCGNLFENDVVGEFNACALSKKQCVPQKADDGAFPLPASSALVRSFDLNSFQGKWYISAGLNPLFDIFDCQVHFFNVQPSGKLYAKLNWRITEPDGEFFTRNTIQRFVQDTKEPGILYNHDNEYLHYEDDWYIVDAVPDQFIAIYYRGRNDAWVGYGGAVVYTRSPTVPPQYRPRIAEAFKRVGVDYKDFKETDNTCGDLSVSPTVLRAEFAKKLFITEEQQLQEALTAARLTAGNELLMAEAEAQKAFEELEKGLVNAEETVAKEAQAAVASVEKELAKEVKQVEREIEEDFKQIERVIETDVWKVSNKKELDSLVDKLKSKPLEAPVMP